MIIGHIATGLLVQALSVARLGPKAIPTWTTTFGSTFNDLLTGLFLLLNIESIRPNPKFTPLGIEFTYSDWSHSVSMILIWGLIWASFASWMTSKTKGGQTTSTNVWYYSLLAVLVHTLADYLVHLPDMALFPNSKIKFGAKLWLYSPVGAWIGELALTALAVGLMYRYYGNAFRFPGALLIAMHLMNYPGAKTNIPFMLGSTLTGTPLRLAVGSAFLMTYLLPNLLISHKLDRPLLPTSTQQLKAQ